MTTFVVAQHIPSTTESARVVSENVEADYYKTNHAGNAVTFYRRMSSGGYSTIRGSQDEKVAFFGRVTSVKVAPPVEAPKPSPSSDYSDENDDQD